MKRVVAVIMIMMLGLTMCSCSGGNKATKITIGEDAYDVSGRFENVAKAFADKGWCLYDYVAKKVISEDCSSVIAGAKYEPENTIMIRKNTHNPYGVDASECIGYYEYGFYEKMCGEVTGIDGIRNIDEREDIYSKGFVDAGRAAVKLYADGKEVDVNQYRDQVIEYISSLADTNSGNYWVNKGIVADMDEYHSYATGYGIVKEVNVEGWNTLLSYSYDGVNNGYKSFAENPEIYLEENPQMINCFAVSMAAQDLGWKYHNGKIKSFVAVVIPTVNETLEHLMFINVACPGEEVYDWFDMLKK